MEYMRRGWGALPHPPRRVGSPPLWWWIGGWGGSHQVSSTRDLDLKFFCARSLDPYIFYKALLCKSLCPTIFLPQATGLSFEMLLGRAPFWCSLT